MLAQLDPIKLGLIGLLIGHQQKAQTQKKKMFDTDELEIEWCTDGGYTCMAVC